MSFEGFPFIVGWELTLACNLCCRHCGSSASQPRADELTLEESLAICDQFPELLVQEVNFTGGEPLLRPDWDQIVLRLSKNGIMTKMLTNGLILKPDILAQMKDVGVVGVGISLDGLNTTHDHIRGCKGLFQRVLNGVDLVLKAGFQLTIITTVNAFNLKELPTIFEMLQSLGVHRWQVQPIFPLGRAQQTPELSLTDQQYMKFGKIVKELGARVEQESMEISPGDSFGYFTEFDTREPAWRGCPAGLLSCGITSDGKIKGCLSLPDEVVEGDLRENDLWNIWFHPGSFAYTRQFSMNELGSACHSCENGELCHGGCSAMSYGSTERFHNDPFCFHGIAKRNR